FLAFQVACDGDNLFSDEPPTPDMEPPTVAFLQPVDSVGVAIGDSVFVSVQVSDDIGVTQLEIAGYYFAADPSLGTDQIIPKFQPKTVPFGEGVGATTVLRYLLASSDEQSAPVKLIAKARDAAGNEGTDTVLVFVGGPRGMIMSPQNGGAAVRGKPL